jgi:hypothetical protein
VVKMWGEERERRERREREERRENRFVNGCQ